MKDTHKVKGRGFRLTPEMDKQWQEHLDSTGLNHSQAVRKAVEAYLFHYYPKGGQSK